MKTFASRFLLPLTLVLLFAFPGMAQIWPPEGLNMPGAYNDNWVNPPTVNAFAGIQKTGGTLLVDSSLGVRRYRTTIHIASSGGDAAGGPYEWLFTSGPTTGYYNNKWGGVTVSMNTIQDYIYSSATNNSVTLVNNMTYTVAIKDNGYLDTKGIWMATATAPVAISTVTQTPVAASVTNNSSITVNVELSGAKSAEEKIYLRYTTDDFTTWTLTEITNFGAGTTGSATIPLMVEGVSVSYYVFSSTLSSGSLTTGETIDLATLQFNNNGGSNYSYIVADNGATTHNTPSIAAGSSVSVGFRENERLQLVSGLTGFYMTWDHNAMYFAFSGGVNSVTDIYNIAFDVDTQGSEGTTAIFSGARFVEGGQKPDYVFQVIGIGNVTAYRNNAGNWESYAITGAAQFGDNPGSDMKIRIPFTAMNGATGAASYSPNTPINVMMWVSDDADKAFRVMPDINPQGNNADTITITHGVKFASLSSGMTPSTDFTEATLPIQLASFSGYALAGSVELSWATVSETNNYGFYVERRSENGSYAAVSVLIPGAGTVLEEQVYNYRDESVTSAGTYYYRIRQVDLNGDASYSPEIRVEVSSVLAVGDDGTKPVTFGLKQNYPNPFNPTTHLQFTIVNLQFVSLKIYNILGVEVAGLVAEEMAPGTYTVSWDASGLPSGVYLSRLSSGGKTDVRSIVLMK